jgi:hypothetical protein
MAVKIRARRGNQRAMRRRFSTTVAVPIGVNSA